MLVIKKRKGPSYVSFRSTGLKLLWRQEKGSNQTYFKVFPRRSGYAFAATASERAQKMPTEFFIP